MVNLVKTDNNLMNTILNYSDNPVINSGNTMNLLDVIIAIYGVFDFFGNHFMNNREVADSVNKINMTMSKELKCKCFVVPNVSISTSGNIVLAISNRGTNPFILNYTKAYHAMVERVYYKYNLDGGFNDELIFTNVCDIFFVIESYLQIINTLEMYRRHSTGFCYSYSATDKIRWEEFATIEDENFKVVFETCRGRIKYSLISKMDLSAEEKNMMAINAETILKGISVDLEKIDPKLKNIIQYYYLRKNKTTKIYDIGNKK